MTEFDLEKATALANILVLQTAERNLTDVEMAILTGAWQRYEYDTIAAQNHYATSYLSQDVAPKLWKLLSKILGEKVRKSNFKEALRRYWQVNGKEAILSPKSTAEPQKNQFKEQHSDLATNYDSVSQLYVERLAIELVCEQALAQPGALLRLKGSRLLGKTSLMERVLAKMSRDDYKVVNLSLKLADKTTHFRDLNRFLRWFCSNISKELELLNQLDEYCHVDE